MMCETELLNLLNAVHNSLLAGLGGLEFAICYLLVCKSNSVRRGTDSRNISLGAAVSFALKL